MSRKIPEHLAGPSLIPIPTYDYERLGQVSANLAKRIRSPWQEQAELYLKGLEAQVREREAALDKDEVLSMICVQGSETFFVESISMPSHNVVALHCRDQEGDSVQLTGHMHAITFSFRTKKVKTPVERKQIGFVFRSAE